MQIILCMCVYIFPQNIMYKSSSAFHSNLISLNSQKYSKLNVIKY